MNYGNGDLIIQQDGSKLPPSTSLGTAGVLVVPFLLTENKQYFYTEQDFSFLQDFHNITAMTQEDAFNLYKERYPNASLNMDGTFGLPIEREMPNTLADYDPINVISTAYNS